MKIDERDDKVDDSINYRKYICHSQKTFLRTTWQKVRIFDIFSRIFPRSPYLAKYFRYYAKLGYFFCLER